MPEGAVYVGRGTTWGNEYVVRPVNASGTFDVYYLPSGSRDGHFQGQCTGIEGARQMAADKFRRWLEYQTPEYRDGWLRPLRGKDLACWCPLGGACHADVLLELANT